MHEPVAGGLHEVGQPVDHLAGIVDPYLDEIGIHVTACVADNLLQSLGLVNLELGVLLKALELELGVDRADILTDAGRSFALFNDEDLRALLGGGHGGDPAARAAANHQYLGIQLFLDVGIADLGLGAQPIGVKGLGGLLHNDGLAACLGDAVRNSLLNRVGGNGSAGNSVHVHALRVQNGLLKHGCSLAAELGGLTGGVDLDTEDFALAELHGDLYVAGNAPGGGSVCAGSVKSLGMGLGGLNGAEHTGGGDAHRARSHALQKISAGKFFCHTFTPFHFLIL